MISVCLATYNGEKYLSKQITSILEQLDVDDELIISDDGSTDNTIKIVQEFKDDRIKFLKINKGESWEPVNKIFLFYRVTKNFERAINEAKGDIIFLSDQDDIWYENKVAVVKEYIDSYWVLIHDCELIDQNDLIIQDSYFKVIQRKTGFVNNVVRSSYLGCCMAFKNELKNIILPFPKKPVPHDIWIGLLSEFYQKSIFIDDKLIKYRRHVSNLSFSAGKSKFSFSFKIWYRFLLVIALAQRLISINKRNAKSNTYI